MQDRAFLPEEIITNILFRLPAKSVGRFRCVCKLWKALLLQSHFIKSHLNRIKHLPLDLLISDLLASFHITKSIYLSSAHHLFDKITINGKELSHARHPDHWMYVSASCDGLILAQNGDVFLINPTTQEIREVPSSPFPHDPENSGSIIGLGYDSVSDDYKIVKLSHLHEYSDTTDEDVVFRKFVDVYSVRQSTWRRVERSSYCNTENRDEISGGFSLHGYLHWLFRTTDDKYVIGAFDLAQEKFIEVPPPRLFNSKNYEDSYLCALGGCLCLYSSPGIHTQMQRVTIETDVWIMKEYGVENSWTKFTITDLGGGRFRPLCFWGQAHILLVKVDADWNYYLLTYNLEDGTLTNVVVLGLEDFNFCCIPFLESLVSPYHSD